MKLNGLGAAVVISLVSAAIHASGIAPPGQALAQKLDAMDVEHHWIAGTHVNWRTGDPDNGKPGKTHCSAFAAAACQRLGIYILRPPDHGQVHLATAQAEWLGADGRSQGWREIESPSEAQRLANHGEIVVVTFPSDDPEKSGHIAIVRPSEKSESRIRDEGPDIVQAGTRNASSTTVKEGFRHHRGAWRSARDFRVRFFAHETTTGGDTNAR